MTLAARLFAAVLAWIAGSAPITGLQPAVRSTDATTQVGTPPVPTTTLPPVAPVITDLTGEALTFLTESYTPAELAAGGDVTIAFSTHLDGGIALVPFVPAAFPECGAADLCVLLAPEWSGRGDYGRVIVDHEWSHVLSFRRQRTGDTDYVNRVVHVDEECLADATASNVLARGGFAPNETPDYVAHYQCEAYWQGRYGTSLADETAALAADLLAWAER